MQFTAEIRGKLDKESLCKHFVTKIYAAWIWGFEPS